MISYELMISFTRSPCGMITSKKMFITSKIRISKALISIRRRKTRFKKSADQNYDWSLDAV